MASLIERIAREMATDDDDPSVQSVKLAHIYTSATDEQRQTLDAAFIALCGWSLGTLIADRGTVCS